MKAETWIFLITTIFLALVSPAYWFITGDWTGTSALVMTTLLTLMVAIYLGFHASRMEPRPEDRKDGEIAEGAGELGFFPPYSWWPLWCAAVLGVMVFATAFGAWWLFIMGAAGGVLTLSGWIFEYYRGEHAH
ncbi:cytochrome c oxidase subunit 4 [Nocardioides perillae]|uniref:Cytochrome c oxidase polypeptide 4 n=1 Tax=Nocardioides perillae TaxID=1119534 RepID=A0A7Y9RWZ9_9ACTN|nr:cytochrome c oxidase subunit 4 [Nocardioides perillae]NYG56313.1 magnesium-transporting ATPase (P-type) [Nocardioides perillae]